MVRLRRVRVDSPGLTRRRAGKGFAYGGEGGHVPADEDKKRIKALAIPPAWRDVWISPWPNGHIQATGLDEDGRRQYLYHEQWQRRRARLKHDHVLEVARRLPAARRRVRRDLAPAGMPREKALALAFRLLDVAYFRAGGEGYAAKYGSYGLATLRRDHVQILPRTKSSERGAVRFRFPAKSGQRRDVIVTDEDVAKVLRTLLRRSDRGRELLAWREDGAWHDVTSRDLAAYVKECLGPDASPKDFRTWHATVLAARGLADAGPPPASERARRRVERQVVCDVAERLGNTPAVCRSSYIDPRLFALWQRGDSLKVARSQAAAERNTLELLIHNPASTAVSASS